MTQTPATEPIRLSGPSAVAAAVPYLLGFVPTESLVVVLSGGPRGRVELTLRFDLPRTGTDPDVLIRELPARLARVQASTAIAVVFADPGTEAPPPRRWRDLVGALEAALADSAIHLTDALFVSGDRWWSYLCTDPSCCPAAGSPVHDSAGWAAAAEAVGHGLSAAASRCEFAAAFAPAAPDLQAETGQAIQALLARLPRVGSSGWQVWRDAAERDFLAAMTAFAVPGEGALSSGTAARLLTGLAEFRVRDPLLWHLANLTTPEEWVAAQRLLIDLVGRAPDPWLAPAATVLAIVCWQRGNGAQAQLALDRIQPAFRDYSLAQLVARALELGLPPTEWVRMLKGLDLSGCRTGLAADPAAGRGPQAPTAA